MHGGDEGHAAYFGHHHAGGADKGGVHDMDDFGLECLDGPYSRWGGQATVELRVEREAWSPSGVDGVAECFGRGAGWSKDDDVVAMGAEMAEHLESDGNHAIDLRQKCFGK